MAEPHTERARRRGFETVGDMLRSLAVVMLAVLVIVVLSRHPHTPSVTVVDPTQARVAARAVGAFTPEEPVGLGAGWRLTSARFAEDGSIAAPVWHLGWVTPAGGYAALDQSDGPSAAFVATLLTEPVRAGNGSGPFAGWQRWTGQEKGWRAYVRGAGSTTLVVYGSASDVELAHLVGKLQPALG
ncbi:MAG TPA: DUF4245 domain-containing protein [Actinomycetes bacterium]|nr:DUF4245 domain-containing protein [Actinomycetes bacterium]